jgi:hypothetical protein
MLFCPKTDFWVTGKQESEKMELPSCVMRNIASFLPYNERIEVNKMVPIEDRIVKKLDSDGHNLYVKSVMLTEMVIKINMMPSDSLMKLDGFIKLFWYILHTKDTCLLRNSRQDFIDILLGKAEIYSRPISYSVLMVVKHKRKVDALIELSKQLAVLLNTTPRRQEYVPGEAVQIV